MSEKSVALSEMQGQYLASIFQAKATIESNLQTAVGFALAGEGVDLQQGQSYRFEQNPPRLVVTLPDDTPGTPASENPEVALSGKEG